MATTPTPIDIDLGRQNPKDLDEIDKTLYELEHMIHELSLNELDKVASLVNALVFTANATTSGEMGPKQQGMIGAKTVSVIRSGGKFIMAANLIGWSQIRFVDPGFENFVAYVMPALLSRAKKQVEGSRDLDLIDAAAKIPKTDKASREGAIDLAAFDRMKSALTPGQKISKATYTTLLPAANYDPATEIVKCLRSENIFDPVVFLNNTDKFKHAEMQLLEYLAANSLQPDDDLVGVSKPCCRCCSTVLTYYGIRFATWHKAQIGRGKNASSQSGPSWTPPKINPEWRKAKRLSAIPTDFGYTLEVAPDGQWSVKG